MLKKRRYINGHPVEDILLDEEDNIPTCKIFGCRNHLSLQEQMCGSVCLGCQVGEIKTIKALYLDCEVVGGKLDKKPMVDESTHILTVNGRTKKLPVKYLKRHHIPKQSKRTNYW